MPLSNRLLALMLLLFLGTGCDDELTERLGPLSNSTGGFDEILAVVGNNQQDLKGEVKKALSQSYDVLPQYESVFTARVINYENFNNIFRRFRTVIFVSDLSDNSTITQFVKKSIGAENIAKATENKKFYFAFKRNLWATPQLVIFMFAPTKEVLYTRLQNLDKLITTVQTAELEKYKNNAYFNGLNHPLTAKLKSKLNINFPIPNDFVEAIQQDSFYWIRKASNEFSSNIMIDVKSIENNDIPNPIQWRNELGKSYITSNVKDAFMISDTILPFMERKLNRNGLTIYETRGLWKMQHDFMGGPFLNYMVIDEAHKKAILIDGFIYAPGEKKKPLVRSLKAIFSKFEQAI